MKKTTKPTFTKPVVLNAVKPYRRKLLTAALKLGKGTFRVFGEAGNWSWGIDTGDKVVRITAGRTFPKMGSVVGYLFSRYNVKAAQLKLAA